MIKNDKKFSWQIWVKKLQIPKKLLNDHFTNVIFQNIIKTNFVSNYRTYLRKKNKKDKNATQ